MNNPLVRLFNAITDKMYTKSLNELEGYIMTYRLMKRIIERGGYDRESTMDKLDVFLMADRITPEEYQELVDLMGGESNG